MYAKVTWSMVICKVVGMFFSADVDVVVHSAILHICQYSIGCSIAQLKRIADANTLAVSSRILYKKSFRRHEKIVTFRLKN